ncbi:DUF2071 domain-containing protein [Halobacillus locisalis]|uniref:DUF2071 domain-containing protein n=1 Tax=Halobacillus locisalis TaxID=220753 RepID=A0A838CSW5_9BACI|nr:DUF2071 domain-containing protein [Halobacillus locisalis]MBA2175100.1 DUF2071 domain-containing protein [Halobacillus locisalis]
MKTKSWIMHQTWEELVFMHWPVSVDLLRPHIPETFEIDTYDGTAWIAIVPFRMNDIRFRGMPSVPLGNQLLELNVRTYVSYNGEPGVYFVTLDANHPLGIFLARTVFGLPYVHANMRMDQTDEIFHFTSRRTHSGYAPAHFHASFKTISPPVPSQPGSLLYWLTERYALWVIRGSSIYKGPIYHRNWSLQKAESEVYINQLTDFLPASVFESKPMTYYSKSLDTYIFPFEKKGYIS